MAKINFTILDNTKPSASGAEIRTPPSNSEKEVLQMCMNELTERGIRFPTHFRVGDRDVLVHTEDMKITLKKMEVNAYRFFYHSIVNGNGTPFPSALFAVEIA